MEIITNDHLPEGERFTRIVLPSDSGGNIVVATGAMHTYKERSIKDGREHQYAPPSFRLHDELVCWLFENAPNHVIKNDMDGITVDIYDSQDTAEEFSRAVVCLRVMGATVLGNTWEFLSELSRNVKNEQT